MRRRKATPEERAEMVRLVRDFITNHGWRALERAIDQAEEDLRPPLTPRQQRRIEAERERAKIRRKREQEAREAEEATADKLRRELHVARVHNRVYNEMGIQAWRRRVPSWAREKPLPVTRRGLAKAIRVILRSRGLTGNSQTVSNYALWDAPKMRPAVEAIIAWERGRLGKLSLRLDKAGERIEGRSAAPPHASGSAAAFGPSIRKRHKPPS